MSKGPLSLGIGGGLKGSSGELLGSSEEGMSPGEDLEPPKSRITMAFRTLYGPGYKGNDPLQASINYAARPQGGVGEGSLFLKNLRT